MRQFGKAWNTQNAGKMGPTPIETNTISGYPTINKRSLHRGTERFMCQQGTVQYPPTRPIFTQYASGGCVPVCAAEISPPRQVRWIYLMHAHGGNPPIDLTYYIHNPAHVHVCLMVYDHCSSQFAVLTYQEDWFKAMDPNNVIPDANTMLIYGPHTVMAITRKAMIAVDFEN